MLSCNVFTTSTEGSGPVCIVTSKTERNDLVSDTPSTDGTILLRVRRDVSPGTPLLDSGVRLSVVVEHYTLTQWNFY